MATCPSTEDLFYLIDLISGGDNPGAATPTIDI